MSETSSRVRLMANLQAAVAEAVSGTTEERGRGFASDREAWAELKSASSAQSRCTPTLRKSTRKCGARSRTGTRTLSPRSQEFERSPVFSPRRGANVRPRKIAVISESND